MDWTGCNLHPKGNPAEKLAKFRVTLEKGKRHKEARGKDMENGKESKETRETTETKETKQNRDKPKSQVMPS